MDIVWKINFSSRECRGEKIYRFAQTFRLVENRLKSQGLLFRFIDFCARSKMVILFLCSMRSIVKISRINFNFFLRTTNQIAENSRAYSTKSFPEEKTFHYFYDFETELFDCERKTLGSVYNLDTFKPNS